MKYGRCIEIDRPFNELPENEQKAITNGLIQSYQDNTIAYPKLEFGPIIFSENKELFKILSPTKKFVRGYYCEGNNK